MRHLSNVIAVIHNGIIKNLNTVYYPTVNKKIIHICKLLFKMNVIRSYSLEKNTKRLKIKIKYFNDIPTCKKLYLHKYLHKQHTYSYVELLHLNLTSNQVHILLTSKGFLTLQDTLLYKMGGVLILTILY